MSAQSPDAPNIIFSSPDTPVSAHRYARDPNVYFLNKRGTNVHVATLTFENNNNDAHPVALRALLAICIDQLEHNTNNLYADEVSMLLNKANELLHNGEAPT